MNNRHLSLIILIILVVSCTLTVSAKTIIGDPVNYYDLNTATLQISGQKTQIGYVRIKDEVYLNLREAITGLAGKVYWYHPEKHICIVVGNPKVFIDLRENVFLRNGYEFELTQELQLINGQNYILASDILNMLVIY